MGQAYQIYPDGVDMRRWHSSQNSRLSGPPPEQPEQTSVAGELLTKPRRHQQVP